MISTSVRPLALAALAAAVLFVVPAAQAQPRRGFGDVADPRIDSQEIESYKDMLGLSDDQLEAARELHQAYLAELAKLNDRAREVTEAARNEFRETRNVTVWRDLRGVIEKFSDQRDALTESTLADLRLLLDADQDARWITVEQFRRRRHDLVRGASLSGESVDLIAITDESKLPPESADAVRSLLTQYAPELDRAIVERDRIRTRLAEAERAEDAGNGDLSEDEEQQYFEDIKQKSAAIRDLNRRYVRQIVAEIGPEPGAEFEAVFQRASFPRVYSESAAEKAFRAASDMADLRPEQAEQIRAAEAAYLRDRAAANARIAAAIEEQEMAQTEAPRRGPGFFRDRGGNSEVQPLLEARRAADTAAVERLRAILTEDQAGRLPENPVEDWRSSDFESL
jgi:hypothetical protein